MYVVTAFILYYFVIPHCLMLWKVNGLQVALLDFSRDRKMMSVLCSRKQLEIMFSKGAPESIISRCTNILCNDDGSTVPLTANLRTELEARFRRLVFVFVSVSVCFFLSSSSSSFFIFFLPLFHSFGFWGGIWVGAGFQRQPLSFTVCFIVLYLICDAESGTVILSHDIIHLSFTSSVFRVPK